MTHTFFSLRISSKTVWLRESGPTWRQGKITCIITTKRSYLEHFSWPQSRGNSRWVVQFWSHVIEDDLRKQVDIGVLSSWLRIPAAALHHHPLVLREEPQVPHLQAGHHLSPPLLPPSSSLSYLDLSSLCLCHPLPHCDQPPCTGGEVLFWEYLTLPIPPELVTLPLLSQSCPPLDALRLTHSPAASKSGHCP